MADERCASLLDDFLAISRETVLGLRCEGVLGPCRRLANATVGDDPCGPGKLAMPVTLESPIKSRPGQVMAADNGGNLCTTCYTYLCCTSEALQIISAMHVQSEKGEGLRRTTLTSQEADFQGFSRNIGAAIAQVILEYVLDIPKPQDMWALMSARSFPPKPPLSTQYLSRTISRNLPDIRIASS